MAGTNSLPIFLESHIEWGSVLLDNVVDCKALFKNRPLLGAGAEALDGKMFKMTLNAINENVSPYVPDEYKDEIHAAMNDVIDGDRDYEVAIDNAMDVLSQLKDKLNVPSWVKKMINGLIELVESALEVYLEKKLTSQFGGQNDNPV